MKAATVEVIGEIRIKPNGWYEVSVLVQDQTFPFSYFTHRLFDTYEAAQNFTQTQGGSV